MKILDQNMQNFRDEIADEVDIDFLKNMKTKFKIDTDWAKGHEMENKIIDRFNEWIHDRLKSVITKNSVEELTDDEKFAVGYKAGVKCEWGMVDGKFKGKTEKFNIIKDGDKWVTVIDGTKR